MKSKLMLMSIGVLLLVTQDFSASTVYASDGTTVENDSNICANDSYYYQTDTNGMYEADIVSTDTRQLLATSNSSNGEIEFMFPANAGALNVYVYQYTDSQRSLVDTSQFTISDCGYEVVVDDYETLKMQTTITKTEDGYQFTKPDLDDYNLYINELEPNDDGISKKVKFKNDVADIQVATDVIQLSETFISSKGKQKVQYFEIDLSDQMVIREISNIHLNVIAPMEYLDRKILIRIVLGLIVLVILYLMNTMLVKQYRARKEYKRKYELYQKKQREQRRKEQQEELLRKQRKQQMIKQKKLESERRANLEIRK